MLLWPNPQNRPVFQQGPSTGVVICWPKRPWASAAWSGFLCLMLPFLTQSTSCWWHPAICCPDQVCDLGFPCFSLLAAHQGFLRCCWLWSVGNGWGIFNLISRLCGVFVFCKYGWNRTNHIQLHTKTQGTNIALGRKHFWMPDPSERRTSTHSFQSIEGKKNNAQNFKQIYLFIFALID